MKIFAIETEVAGEKTFRLVRAESLPRARAHVFKVVNARLATQDDMLRAVGENAVAIEDATDAEPTV